MRSTDWAFPYRWVTWVMPLDRAKKRHAEIEKIRKRWFSKRKGILTLLREALYREEATPSTTTRRRRPKMPTSPC